MSEDKNKDVVETNDAQKASLRAYRKNIDYLDNLKTIEEAKLEAYTLSFLEGKNLSGLWDLNKDFNYDKVPEVQASEGDDFSDSEKK